MTASRPRRRASDLTVDRVSRPGAGMPARAAFAWLAAATVVVSAVIWWQVSDRVPMTDDAPTWSPDGRQLAFIAQRGGARDIFIMRADGADRRPVTSTPADERAPAWSPDGRRIAFERDVDRNVDIYAIETAGTNEARLTTAPSRDLAPAWAPDGQRIAFLSDRDAPPAAGAAALDVYVMQSDGTDVRRLTTSGGVASAQFSPDLGSVLIDHAGDVHVMDLGTHLMRRLTYAPTIDARPVWSPDGRQLAFERARDGRRDIVAMNADGSNQHVLVSLAHAQAREPRWSADGNRIAFVQSPDGTAGAADSERIISVVDLSSGRITRVSR